MKRWSYLTLTIYQREFLPRPLKEIRPKRFKCCKSSPNVRSDCGFRIPILTSVKAQLLLDNKLSIFILRSKRL